VTGIENAIHIDSPRLLSERKQLISDWHDGQNLLRCDEEKRFYHIRPAGDQETLGSPESRVL
jgi:hypothetical protein